MPVTKERTQLHVSGMTCEECTKRVSKVLERLEGVREVQVTLEDETARVDYDPGQVTVEALEETVEKAGYEVEEK